MKQKTRRPTVASPPKLPEENPIGLALLHVDTLLERIRTGKVKSFEESALSQLRKLTLKQLTIVRRHYGMDDMKAALAKDPYFMEAYSHYTTDRLKLALVHLKALHALKPDKNANGKIRVAGHRKRKTKAPDLIVKKVLYLEVDSETKQTSIHPRELVGATQMWTYNTKTRKLGCYYAKNETGLTAKGTTILDYDEARSLTKTIRKPAQQIKDFLTKAKYWDSIKAVPQAISPRLNRETIILRVVAK
jgi:hypothetical protein